MVIRESRIFTCDLCDVDRLDAGDYFNHLFNRLHQIGLENSSTLTSLPLERIIGRLNLVDDIDLKDKKIPNLVQPLNDIVYKVDILLRLNEYLRLEQEGFLSQISDKPNPVWLDFFISIIEVCYEIKFASTNRTDLVSSANTDANATPREIIESKCLQLGVQFLEKFFALLATSQTPPSVVATFGSSKYHIRHYWTKCISLLLNCDFDDSKGVEYRLAINYLAEKLIPGKGLLIKAG